MTVVICRNKEISLSLVGQIIAKSLHFGILAKVVIDKRFQQLKFSSDLEEKFRSLSESRTFDRGEVVYRAGDMPQGLYLLKEGLVGLAIMSEGGREHLVRLFVSHDFMSHRSLFACEDYHATATALEASSVDFVPKDSFFRLIEKDKLFASFFLKRLAFDLGESERRHKRLVEDDARSRVAGGVLYLKDIDHQHVWTRKEIADFSGTTTETVIRTLGRFEGEGLITQKGRPIEILKRQSLIQIARFD